MLKCKKDVNCKRFSGLTCTYSVSIKCKTDTLGVKCSNLQIIINKKSASPFLLNDISVKPTRSDHLEFLKYVKLNTRNGQNVSWIKNVVLKLLKVTEGLVAGYLGNLFKSS